MRITKLKLNNWKNFQNVDVTLHSRMFLVGVNAAGKSNFLDAFRFISDVIEHLFLGFRLPAYPAP